MSMTEKMIIANVSGFIYGLSLLLVRREPEVAKILADKAKRLDSYLEPVQPEQKL